MFASLTTCIEKLLTCGFLLLLLLPLLRLLLLLLVLFFLTFFLLLLFFLLPSSSSPSSPSSSVFWLLLLRQLTHTAFAELLTRDRVGRFNELLDGQLTHESTRFNGKKQKEKPTGPFSPGCFLLLQANSGPGD